MNITLDPSEFSDVTQAAVDAAIRRLLADLLLSQAACELCNQLPQEHFIDRGQWAGKHCCTRCWESLPEQQEEESNSK